MTSTNIVYRLPREHSEKITKLRSTYGLWSGGNQNDKVILKDHPHFSIKPSFYIVDDSKFMTKLHEISFSQLPVSLKSIEVFNTRFGNTVVALIEASDSLRKLQEEIDSALETCIESKHPEYEGKNYNHHVTLAYNVPSDLLVDFKSSAKKIMPLNLVVNKLEVMKTVDEQSDERECIYVLQ